MDEQRLQAYQQLIQQLLNCPNGEEPAILEANSELLDADFLQVVPTFRTSFCNIQRLQKLGLMVVE
ncbi:hypothetical protein A0J48_022095 [Sphaerospermopsis aphanizomenoides BCCUSP55]|uniref:hypothetical protein n=1 Tax=Sphaerospermopsis aphanizomenoides TaxID=459663 RepID=UPI001904BDD9|nr:hypothetical protein [Sphaerospermopsis aphanizomenoides]MBK1990183.1 hypothetical protein [Sphaerospermopsis aphanizomenoides BCCUSP55]